MALRLTYGPDNIDTLLTTTQSVVQKMGDYLNDAIFNSIPLLNWLNSKAKVSQQGGASILIPLLYAKNTTFAAYSGLDLFDTGVQEGLTLAQAHWRNYGGTIALVGDELRQNAGQGKIFDYVKAKTMQATMSGADALAVDLLATTQGTKKVQALPILVDTTSSVFDIARSTNSWWQSQVTASGSFAGQGLADMRTLRDNIMIRKQAGGVTPDFGLTTATVKQLYEAALVPSIRYESRQAADASFESLKFSSMVVELDNNCPSGNFFMLSSKVLQFVVNSDTNWKVGKFVEPTNQDAFVAKVIWMGNLVSNNPRCLGKLTGVTA